MKSIAESINTVVNKLRTTHAKLDWRGQILDILGITSVVLIIISTLINIFIILSTNNSPQWIYIFEDIFATLIFLIVLILNRQRHLLLSAVIFLGIVLVCITLIPPTYLYDKVAILYTFPTILASFILFPGASVVVGSISVLLYNFVYVPNGDWINTNFSFVLAILILALTAWFVAQRLKTSFEQGTLLQKRYSSLVENSPAIVYSVDISRMLQWTYVSPQIQHLLGFTPEEWMEGSGLWTRQLHPDDRERVIAADHNCRLSGLPFKAEYRLCHRDGHMVWIMDSGNPIHGLNAPDHIQGVLVDITARKRTEAIQNAIHQLSQSTVSTDSLERLFVSVRNTLAEFIPVENYAVALYDPASNMVSYPYYIDEIDPPTQPHRLGNNLVDYIIRSGEPLLLDGLDLRAMAARQEIKLEGTPFEWWMGAPLMIKGVVKGVATIRVYRQGNRYTKSDLETFTLISYQLALMIDQIQANLGLRASEEKYRRLFDDAVLGVFQSSMEGELITGNLAFARMLGYATPGDILYTVKDISHDLFVNPEKWEMIKERSIIEKQTFPNEVSLKKDDGTIVVGNLYAWVVKDDSGEVKFIEGFIEDITAQKRIEAELKETSLFALEVINHANTGVIVIDQQSRILVFNPYMERITGVLSKEIVGKRLVDLFPDYYKLGWDTNIKTVIVDGETLRLDDLYFQLPLSGKTGWVSGSVSPHQNAVGEIIGAIIIVTDESARVETYQQLRTSEHLYRSTVDTIEDWLHVVNTDLQVELMNAALRDKCIELGLPIEQHHLKDIFPFLNQKVVDEYQYVINNQEVVKTIETSYLSGRKYITETIKEPVIEDGRVVRIITTMRDITQQKEAEQQLLAALREKEVLVREIHHRVKNNLQVMTSLLSLQADTVVDPGVRDMFRETQSRVRSMSLIHEVLYQSDDLSQIDLQTYFEKLTGHLTYLFGTNPGVRLILEVDPVHMKIDTVIPCGLIVNELVTNAYKYAFTGREKGIITVGLSATPGENGTSHCKLSIADDGVGIPPEIEIGNSPTLGLQLVKILSSQLKGELTLDIIQGTRFDITFTETLSND